MKQAATAVRFGFGLGMAAFAAWLAMAEVANPPVAAVATYEEGLDLLERRLYGAAREQFVTACEAGHGAACFQVGDMWQSGTVAGHTNTMLARSYHEKACDLGYLEGCFRLALLTDSFAPDEAASLLDETCARGFALACQERGRRITLSRESTVEDYAVARIAFETGCTLGDRESCYQFARLLADGKGGETDLVAARTVYGQACELDHADGCFELSMMQVMGKGGPADIDAARATEAKRCALPGQDC